MTADTFFSEFNKLLLRYPKVPPNIHNSENSEYGEHLANCKNMHIAFDSSSCSDCLYLYDSYIAKNCIDCDYTVESELCYESVDPFKCYNSAFLEYCVGTRDAYYSANCFNCHNIFGCINLAGKSFCIFNRQLSEEEYKRRVKEYLKWPPEKVLETLETLKKRYPLTQTHEAHNENSAYGNYSHYNKNCYMCFDSAHNEGCSYLYDSHHNASSFDMTCAYDKNELSYQIVDSVKLFNCNFAFLSNNSHDSSYIFNCRNVKNCIGCVSLSNKQYCILNRQLSKEEYERVSKQLLEEFKQKNFDWADVKF